MTPLIEACLALPVVRLSLEYESDRYTFLPPNLAAKLRGALGERLRALADGTHDLAAQQAFAAARETIKSVPRAKGFGTPLFAFDTPWRPMPIGPGDPVGLQLLLMENAALLWPCWLEALRELQIDTGCRLVLTQCTAITGSGMYDVDDVLAAPETALCALGAHVIPIDERPRALRIHLLTPTCWNAPTNFDPKARLAPRFLVTAVFRRLTLVADRDLSDEEKELRDLLLPSRVRIPAARALTVTQTVRPADSRKSYRERRGEAGDDEAWQEYGGMMGHFDLRSHDGRPLPDVLVRALEVIQVIHLGTAIAFGCGQVFLECLG